MKVQRSEYFTFLSHLCAEPHDFAPFALQNCVHWSSVERGGGRGGGGGEGNSCSHAKEQNILCDVCLSARGEAWLDNT